MKRAGLSFLCLALMISWTQAGEDKANTLTPQERNDGWKLLFDGKTLTGWRVYKKEDAGNWTVKDGQLVSGGGDLMTAEQYGDFIFSVDWKFVKGNNSGIIYRVGEEGKTAWVTGPEMQIMTHGPDDKLGKTAGGSLYDAFAPTANALKPATEWNTFKIVASGKRIEHWVNGKKVVDVEIGSDAWNKAIEQSKWKDNKLFASRPAGHIALQDHGGQIVFQNIKIKVQDASASRVSPREVKKD